MFHLLIFVTFAVLLAYYYVRIKYSYWEDRNIPTLEPTFPFGNTKQMSTEVHGARMFQSLYDRLKGSGPYGGIFMFMSPAVLALDPDFIKDVLVKDFASFHDRGIYFNEVDDPLSANLLALEGTTWRNLRNKLSPTFTSGKLKMMLPSLVEVGEKLTQFLIKTSAECDEIEMKDVLARFTTDIIGSCAFGLDCNSVADPNSKFRSVCRKIVEVPRLSVLGGMFTLTCRDLARKMHVKTTHDDVTEFFMQTITDTIAYREQNNVRRNDFMDLLIKLKNDGYIDEHDADKNITKLTVKEIAAQSFIFFLGGFETSSTAMSYILYELSLNLEVQEKARRCVQETLKRHNNQFTYEALMEMTYIEQCILESLRKYPPIANIFRRTTQDYRAAGTKNIIERSTTLIIPVYGIHHDPEYYPNPEKYDPDRFAPDAVAARKHFTFLPFGEGPRMCIGQRFGLMQARIGLALLLNHFKFTPSARSVVPLLFSPTKFILTPLDGLYLHVAQL